MMLEIKNAYFSDAPFTETTICARFLEILVLVGRSHAENTQQRFDARNAKQKEYMDKFLAICHYINEHFTENLTLGGGRFPRRFQQISLYQAVPAVCRYLFL